MPVPLPVPINKEQKHNNSTTSIFRRHFYLQASMQKHHTQHGTNLDPHTHKLIVQVSNLTLSKPQSCPPSRKLEDHPWLHPVRHKDGTVRALVHLWFAHVPGMKIYEIIRKYAKTNQSHPQPQSMNVRGSPGSVSVHCAQPLPVCEVVLTKLPNPGGQHQHGVVWNIRCVIRSHRRSLKGQSDLQDADGLPSRIQSSLINRRLLNQKTRLPKFWQKANLATTDFAILLTT